MNRLYRAGWVVLAGLLGSVVASGAAAGRAQDAAGKNVSRPRHILIIRHAEKSGDRDDAHLSARGKERAEALPRLFVASNDRPDPLPTPDVIFAAASHTGSRRPVETVTPLARQLRRSIDDRFDSKPPPATRGMVELGKELFGTPKYAGRTILISWRHTTIPGLARVLKATGVPEKWDEGTFDRVWQITYAGDGTATFRDRPQRLLPGDAEK